MNKAQIEQLLKDTCETCRQSYNLVFYFEAHSDLETLNKTLSMVKKLYNQLISIQEALLGAVRSGLFAELTEEVEVYSSLLEQGGAVMEKFQTTSLSLFEGRCIQRHMAKA